MAGACEYGNELWGSIKCGEFLDYLQKQLASQKWTLLHGVSKGVSIIADGIYC